MKEPNENLTDAKVAKPPDHLFESKHVIDDSHLANGTVFNIAERIEYPPEGGVYVHYKGMPFPKKGFPNPEASWMNDIVKRVSVFLLRTIGSKDMLLPAIAFSILPWKMKLRTIDKGIYNFNRVALWMFQSIFMKDEYYSNPCKPMKKVVSAFFRELGIENKTAEDFGKVIATMFEYDDSYRYRFEDVMSETSREALIAKPFREFRRLGEIFRKREKFADMFSKLDGMIAIGSVALLHPKIRKAWKAAWASINDEAFTMMQLDSADKYHTLIRGDYDFQGRSLASRLRRLAMIHTVSKCHQASTRFANEVDNTLLCSKCGKKCETMIVPPPTVTVQK